MDDDTPLAGAVPDTVMDERVVGAKRSPDDVGDEARGRLDAGTCMNAVAMETPETIVQLKLDIPALMKIAGSKPGCAVSELFSPARFTSNSANSDWTRV